ncbi:MAG: MmgE/PrpD family protein [Atribacterota bacterium]|nr:MmgE/PrpD family protein [Atribacterota bacterium]
MITKKLSEFIHNTDYEDIPSEIIQLAKMCFLDWLGCTVAAADSETARIFRETVLELGGNPDATIIPYGDKTSITNASLVNAALSHFLELDDIHKKAMYHPGIPVIPAVLALSEKLNKTGKDIITGIVMGYETGIRIGIAINPSHFRIWHTTGTAGTFASAAATGKIMGLSEKQLINALGNAGTQAAGLWEFINDGAMTKPLHPAKAAQNGLLSSLLAQKGFTGPSRIIEGKQGFATATSKETNLESITADLGNYYCMGDIGFKVHAGCRHTNSPVDGTLALVQKYDIKPEDISQVTVKVYQLAMDLTGKTDPQNPTDGKFSIPYCVASAIRFRHCNIDVFSPELIKDPQTRNILDKINLVVDESVEKEFPMGYASIVEIKTIDGKEYAQRTNYAKGDPENPVSWDDIEKKFINLTGKMFPTKKAHEIINKIKQLEDVGDIREIIQLVVK